MKELILSEFPTTRYQGSKRKILPWLFSVFSDLEFESVLDAFGGSGSVSYLFKKMGKSVTFNDKLYFNYLVGKAIIENANVKLTNDDLISLTSRNEENIYYKFIQETFKDIYFLHPENEFLDLISSNILQMNHYPKDELEFKKALSYYSLFQSCLIKRPYNLFHRNNLYFRINDRERNFGNKSTWDRSFEEYLRKFAQEANKLVFDSQVNCYSMNQSALKIDSYGYDLVYLDPPYLKRGNKNESSDYLKCYHFLEGISQYDEWSRLIDYESLNLRFKQLSEFNDFKINDIYRTYEELIYNFRKSIIVMSYKKGGVPSINFLVNLIKKVKGNATTVSKHYKYALNRQNGDARNNREVLIIGL